MRIILIVTAIALFFLETLLELSNVGQNWELFWVVLKRWDFKYSSFVILCLFGLGFLIALIPFKNSRYRTKAFFTIPILFILFSAYYLAGMVDFYYGLSEDHNYFTAKKDISNGKIQLLAAGLLVDESTEVERARDSLCSVFGFKSVSVGCISSEGIERYNETMKDFLKEKNGKDWEKVFHRELDIVRNRNNQKSPAKR
ncbi:MAG TPA: hypothetical protein VGB63_14435 [Pedobacter sp.]